MHAHKLTHIHTHARADIYRAEKWLCVENWRIADPEREEPEKREAPTTASQSVLNRGSSIRALKPGP